MEEQGPVTEAGPRLTRRRLVLVGAAGATGAWLGGFARLEEVARAATSSTPAPLRRSTYLSLSSPDFAAAVDGGTASLRLVAVEDLPIAASLPDLRGHEDAFAVRFQGKGGLRFARGTHRLSHPDLGTFDLFVAPVEGGGAYEAVVDRTIRLPGVDEQGAPTAVRAGARADDARDALEAPAAGRARRARLLRASLRRGGSTRRLVADVVLGGGGDVDTVRALLLRRGRLVAVATASPRGTRARLRFGLRGHARRGQYRLVLTAVDRDGNVTRLHRALRLRQPMVPLDRVTVETFAPAVGETFALDDREGTRLDLELLSATRAGAGPEGRRDPFSLLFRGPTDPVLPQRIYELAHPGVGALEIFIVPVGRDESGTRYEAVFA